MNSLSSGYTMLRHFELYFRKSVYNEYERSLVVVSPNPNLVHYTVGIRLLNKCWSRRTCKDNWDKSCFESVSEKLDCSRIIRKVETFEEDIWNQPCAWIQECFVKTWDASPLRCSGQYNWKTLPVMNKVYGAYTYSITVFFKHVS